LTNVLFVHAPNRPYEDATLKRVFGLIVESLHGLEQEGEALAAAEYVLGRMAMCGLSCLLVDLPDLPGDGGVRTADLALELFSAVLGGISPAHTGQVEVRGGGGSGAG
jgi:hypothetical protein